MGLALTQSILVALGSELTLFVIQEYWDELPPPAFQLGTKTFVFIGLFFRNDLLNDWKIDSDFILNWQVSKKLMIIHVYIV
jgi:hypothetical protein